MMLQYKINYLSSHQIVSMEVIVASDYIVNLAVFGKINTKNMTFNKINSIVEQKVGPQRMKPWITGLVLMVVAKKRIRSHCRTLIAAHCPALTRVLSRP